MNAGAKLAITVLLIAGLIALGVADYRQNMSRSEPTLPPALQADEIIPLLEAQGFTLSDVQQSPILAQVAAENAGLTHYGLLLNNDRAGSIAWLEGNTLGAFVQLKESLLSAFSPRITDLRDTTVHDAGAQPYDLLTFLDPAISEERLIFIRTLPILYELRIAEGYEDEMNGLIKTLTE